MNKYYVTYSTISDVLYNEGKLQNVFDCHTLAVAIRFLEMNINVQEICAFEVRYDGVIDEVVCHNDSVFSDACYLNLLIAKAMKKEVREED